MQRVLKNLILTILLVAIASCGDDSNTPQTNNDLINTDPIINNPIDSEDMSGSSAELALINSLRSQARSCGTKNFNATSSLSSNAKLKQAAKVHVDDMINNSFFDHTGSSGSSPFQRVENQGYEYQTAGENIAQGQTSIEEAFQSWIDSPGHCENIMSPDFQEYGLSYSQGYWVMVFGTSF